MDGGTGVKAIVYNTKKDSKGKKKKKIRKRREREREKKRVKKYNSKIKEFTLLVIVLRQVRGYFLHVCACNFFPLTLYTTIFILDSD